jgi:hypothetical protein
MQIAPFELERYFGRYEFSARYLLSSSDCEALSLAGLLAMADDQMARMWRELRLGYTESWGHPLLREEIAGLYNGLAAENVLTVVPEEGIFLLMQALVRPGDHVVCTMPGYQSLYEIARSIGAEVDGWYPHEDQGWRFNPGRPGTPTAAGYPARGHQLPSQPHRVAARSGRVPGHRRVGPAQRRPPAVR